MIARLVVAAALIYFAFGQPSHVVPTVIPERPSAEMVTVVDPVAKIMANADPFDRAVFASTFEQAAALVAGEMPSSEVKFESTLGLRLFTVTIIDIAWRRLAKANGKYAGLNAAVEQAFETVLTRDVKPVTEETKARYVELCRALAWAGVPQG